MIRSLTELDTSNTIQKNHSDDNPVSEVCSFRAKHGTKNGLKITFLNIDSLYKHIDELRIFSEQHSPHIICLNETKLSKEISDELLHMDGFRSIVRKDRNRHGEGVAVYVKNGIKKT